MASLTVRQLDDKLKRLLRLRAAKHGRSMEDEIRTILRNAAADDSKNSREREMLRVLAMTPRWCSSLRISSSTSRTTSLSDSTSR